MDSPDNIDKICERCHQIKRVAGDTCPDDGGRLHVVGDQQALVGRVIDQKLTLTGVLGKGGMGVVYRARQHSIDREVAVKVLHPGFANDTESVRRFLHEARAATRLEHPNVITVFDFGRTEDGLLYIVMELLTGHNLASEVDRGPIAPERAVHLLTQVADAVHHAHERGLVHRDLKPENVILQSSSMRGDFVKVLDFGIAMMRSYDGIERITRTGAVCGTPAYMSPEQVLGDEVDARSDVYALGVMAYEMLTGEHPLPADTPMRQMLAHLEKPVVPMARAAPGVTIPRALEVAVMHALEKKRDDRTPSALAFANDLVMALGGSGAAVLGVPVASRVGATPLGSRPSDAVRSEPVRADQRGFADTARATALPSRRRLQGLIPYVAVLAVLTVAVLFFALRPEESAPPPAPVAMAASDASITDAQAARTMADGAAAGAAVAVDAGPTVPQPDAVAETVVAETVVAETVVAETVVAETVVAETTVAETIAAAPVPPLRLTSVPSGAAVMVDGKALGTTPLELPRPGPGVSLTLTMKKPGYRSETRTVTAASGDLALSLAPLRVPRRNDSPGIVP